MQLFLFRSPSLVLPGLDDSWRSCKTNAPNYSQCFIYYPQLYQPVNHLRHIFRDMVILLTCDESPERCLLPAGISSERYQNDECHTMCSIVGISWDSIVCWTFNNWFSHIAWWFWALFPEEIIKLKEKRRLIVMLK